MSYGLLANPPVTLLPVFNESSFDYSTSSTSTIDTDLLQAQTDAVNTAATAQSVVLDNIGINLNIPFAFGNGTVGTNLVYNSTATLELGSCYAISFVFTLFQTVTNVNLIALTIQDNFGNIYDAGRAASGAILRNASIASSKLLIGNGNPFTLTFYSQTATNGQAYNYNLQLNILKIK